MADITGWDIVAALGAISGVPALAWQIFTWRASGPSVRVTAAHALPVDAAGGLGDHHFSVTATNGGRLSTTVEHWGLRLPDGGNLVLFQQLPLSTRLPSVLDPQGSATYFMRADEVFARCKERRVKAGEVRPWIRLASGKTIYGKNLPWKD